MSKSRFCLASGIFIFFLAWTTSAYAQSGLTAISFTFVDVDNSANDYTATSASNSGQTVDDNVSYDIFFSRNTTANNNRSVTGYSIGGTSYSFLLDPDTLAIRRIGSASRLSIWMEAEIAIDNTADEIFIAPERQVPERSLYEANLLNIGYDNVLLNTGTNASNIERIDAIYRSGMVTSTPANAIIPVMDRGHNGVFKIAMIKSLDANGDPASYGDLIEVEASDFGGGVVTFDLSILFLQQSLGETPIPTGSSTQDLGGVGISFTELGILTDEVVFGYSLFSIDVNIIDHDLTDISTFPTDSNNSGLDMAAGAVSAVSSDGLLVSATGPGGYKTTLSTWLKANEEADVTTSTEGSTVTDWQDHWLGNHDATTGVAAPTYRSTTSTINFNPTVDFTTSSTSLTIANNTDFNTSASYTNKGLNMAFRTNDTDVTTRQVLYEQGGETRGINVYIRSGNLHISSWNRNNDGAGSPWNNGGTVTSVSTAVTADTEYIVTLEFAGNSGSTGTVTGYLNGASFGSIASVGLLFSDTDGIELGGSDASTQYDDGTNASTNSFEGEISEFIYCNEPGSFTTAIRNRMESYLAIKYGITLSQTSPINYTASDGGIIFNTTDNASLGGYLEYNNDIAGIGRDDDSELDQSASKSENSGSLVTIDRGATISTDDTWLIWGNDAGTLTETAVLTMPDTIDTRISRVWRVAEVNEALTTSVSFDPTGLGLSSNAADFSLLIAANNSDADFSSATVVTGGSFTGDVVTFTGIDLENGQYFTLGTNYMECAPGGVEGGLQLWIKADDEVFNTGTTLATDGQTVSSWGDASNEPTTTDLSDPSNFTTFQTNEVNFNPAVSFTNDPESLQGTFETETTGLTMFLIGNINSTSITEAALFEVSIEPSTRQFFIRRRYASNNAFANVVNEDSWNLWGIDHPSGNTTTITQNSGAFENSYNTTVGASPIGTYTATLGDDVTGGNPFTGFIGELIVYEGALTATEAQRVESYLAIKYGITIDQTSATNYLAADAGTIWDATTNVAHNNDIAGVGRDDASCLSQKQSKSENSDAIVTIGLGAIATDNSANANSFTNNDSYLVWGNDDALTTFAGRTTGVTGTGTVTERMTRVWRVDENTDIGSTSISFDLSTLGYSTTLSDFQLIVSDNSDLSASTQSPAASIDGDVITFSGINLTDGQYFSLGTARSSCGPGGVTASLDVWLRADAGSSSTTDNTTVATWSDQSGNANDGTSDGTPPLYRDNSTENINFNPIMEFDGTNDRLSADFTGIRNSNYSVIAVGERIDANTNNYLLGGSQDGVNTNQLLHFGYRNNTIATLAQFGNDLNISVNAFDSPNASPFLLFGDLDGSGHSVEETRSGNFVRTTNSNTTQIGTSNPDFIGFFGPTDFYGGKIAEIITFSTPINGLQKQQVYTYLAIKYGITLSDDADGDAILGETISGSVTEGDYVASDGLTIVWNYSDNTTYHNDVAGVGRDDDGCFSQKQSTAVDTDDILTIGLGTVATTNLTNVNVFDDDRDYLLWGNDGGLTTEAGANTADVPATISGRMTRVWKVQDTGTVGETELQFDLTGLGYSSSASDFSLIISNTATMASGTLTTGATLDGNILSFTGVNLTDGQFFTLATENESCGPGGVNTNIAVWFRADLDVFSDAGVTTASDGNNVSQWNDQSSGSNNASEDNNGGGAPVEPTFETNEVNFNPIIRFSNAQSDNNSWLETASNSSSVDLTLISVFKSAQSSGSTNDFTESPALISSEGPGTQDYAIGLSEGRPYINAVTASDDFSVRPVTTLNDSQVRILTGTREQVVSATGINLYVNSENVGSGTSNTSPLSDGPTFAIGNHSTYDADGQFEGDIAETIVFNSVLSETEQARVETYLALKYGITRTITGLSEAAEDYLAADGSVIWDIDNQGTTYHNDIFGIGRDDLSCFDQTQSKSENSDAIVTFNKEAGFGTNNAFIISGNDNAALEAIGNKERPAGISSRLNREWRVQRTTSVGSITVTFDISAITGTPTGDNNLNLLRLMVDDDGDFSTGVTLIEPTSTDAGNKTATFTLEFTTGQFYTLGSTETDALPVTLLSFTATNENDNRVVLNWTTAQEVNNAFYSIERSTDAQEFEAIGFIDGAGDSDSVIDYVFTDIQPLEGQGFYRLKQTDHSGTFEYSELLRVFVQKPEQVVDYRVFPNPVENGKMLTIERLNPSIDQVAYHYQVLSINGLPILSGSSEANNSRTSLDTSSLSSGIYLLRITSPGKGSGVIRFIIDK